MTAAANIPRRHLILAATFLLSFLLYMDRVCISTARGPILADLKMSDAQFGWVLSSFAFGYALFQTPAGIFADRRGARRALATIVSCWSFFTGLTAGAINFVSLLLVRFLFGASEAGAFPGMARAAYSWFPANELGLANGVNFSAGRIGAAVTMPILPFMIGRLGWKPSFLVLTALGLLWALGWWRWFRDEPSEQPALPAAERAYILAHRLPQGPAGGTVPPLPLGRMAASRNLWLLMAQYFASNFVFFFCLSWLFPYVQKAYGLGYTQAGFYAMVPLLGGAAGNVFSGVLVDALRRSGRSNLSHKLPAMLGFALAALGLAMSVGQAQVQGAVFWLTVAIFGSDMTLSPSWAFCLDISGRNAGQVSGTMNMAGNLGSAIVALAFPYLLRWTGSPTTFFHLGAVLSIAGALAWVFTRARETFAQE